MRLNSIFQLLHASGSARRPGLSRHPGFRRREVLPLILATLCSVAPGRSAAEGKGVKPLPQAHAHNDYLHERPLLDALEHGFTSVEADIFLVQEKLLVAHDLTGLRTSRTLTALYLDPLRERTRERAGWVFDKGRTLTLLIDIKTDAEPTYAVLHKTLAEYADILTTVNEGKVETKAVTVVISGNRPQETIAAQTVRYAGIDGRLSDLDSKAAADLIPLISDNWRNHFQWNGTGSFPAEERAKLRGIVKQAHERGRRVRFWGSPDTAAVWKELQAAEVDLINTDDLAGLMKFLTAH
jgi:Glycerophosphoryl diester phosphodiesterase family